ncbi:hypothetical protein [Streptomyces angustmyceticus]|uniref:hypothetical protein n=1 Tax=Streptomyces angustmyceticus TaxID=285578 RepID=UPI00344ECE3D
MTEVPDSRDMEIHETFSIAPEFAPSVTITEETFFEHGWQPLTVCVLQAIWFLPADASFDVAMLVDWFKHLGWKSANGKPLGPDAMRRELGLIRKAGYINAARLQGEGGRMVGIHYTVSKRRSSPQDGIPVRPANQENRRSHHVPSFTTHGGPPHVADEANRRSHHVPPITGRGDSPHVADDRSTQVAPCASNGVHPPHPPEEVDTSSPYPLKGAARNEHTSQREEEVGGFTEEDIQAASRFLQMMKKPWNAGRVTAMKCAPQLLEAMRDQGWPSIRGMSELDRRLLERDLTKNPDGITRHSQVLPKRIADLSLYAAVALPARKAAPGAQEDASEAQEAPTVPLSTRSITSLLDGLQKPSV